MFYTSQDVLAETIRVLRRKFPKAPGKIVNDRVKKVGAVMEEILATSQGTFLSMAWTRMITMSMLQRLLRALTLS